MEKTYEVEIVGETALLQNRFAGEKSEAKPTKKKSETTRENNVEETVYRDANGKAYQPANSIRQAMIEAAKAFKTGKATLSKGIASFVEISPEAISLNPQEYTTDRRAVVIPSTGGRVMRNRAKFEKWSLKFSIKTTDDAEIDGSQMQEVLQHAGKYVGIGDYRPQKKGQFGKFRVASFNE